MIKRWPLVSSPISIPVDNHPGAFGAVRKHDIHTGVDLYCAAGTEVLAITEGTVVNILPFTGPLAGSSWWNPTWAVMIEYPELKTVVCYGEINPEPSLCVGHKVVAGQTLGTVARVLVHDKGLPTTMLHFETYKLGTVKPVWWYHNRPQPHNLLNPTALLQSLIE